MSIKFVQKVFFAAVITTLFGLSAQAQFQGHIVMNLYSEEKGVQETNMVNMYVTGDRIMLQGDESVKLQKGLNAQGLLVRHDKNDFIVLTGEKDAMQITKNDIESMMQMASAFGGNNQSPDATPKTSYRYTDRTKTILGYECAEMIIEEEGKKDDYLSVWLTKGIDINWGMLAEPWKNMSADIENSFKIPRDAVFSSDNFPLLVERYKNGKVATVAEVTQLERTSVAKAMVELPQGVNLVGFGDFMFRMMMQN